MARILTEKLDHLQNFMNVSIKTAVIQARTHMEQDVVLPALISYTGFISIRLYFMLSLPAVTDNWKSPASRPTIQLTPTLTVVQNAFLTTTASKIHPWRQDWSEMGQVTVRSTVPFQWLTTCTRAHQCFPSASGGCKSDLHMQIFEALCCFQTFSLTAAVSEPEPATLLVQY